MSETSKEKRECVYAKVTWTLAVRYEVRDGAKADLTPCENVTAHLLESIGKDIDELYKKYGLCRVFPGHHKLELIDPNAPVPEPDEDYEDEEFDEYEY